MGAWLADFRFDLRRGWKLLRKSPGFTLAAVLTLALGIGATSAIFSVLHSIVLRPLPFPNAEQLVSVEEVNQRDGRTRPPTIEVHEAWRERAQALTDVGVGITGGVDVSVSGPAGATRISLGGIALDTLSVLGVRPVVGRWFERDEVTVEGDTAATLVISYGVWQDYFGGDPDVVGKTIPGWDAAWGRTIIGVMPPDFWVDPSMADVKGWFAFNVGRFPGARAQTLARLTPGVDYGQAEAELTTIATSIEAAGPGGADAADWRVRLEPLHDIVTARIPGNAVSAARRRRIRAADRRGERGESSVEQKRDAPVGNGDARCPWGRPLAPHPAALDRERPARARSAACSESPSPT